MEHDSITELYASLSTLASQNRDEVKGRIYRYNNFQWAKHILYSRDLSLYRYDGVQSNYMYDHIEYNKNEPIKIAVITAAAPNLNNNIIYQYPYAKETVDAYRKNPDSIYSQFSEIIKHIYLLPIRLNEDVNILILGAIGCGDFSPTLDDQFTHGAHNKKIAQMFLEHLIKTPVILSIYDYICFAIPQFSIDDNHYDTFYNVFKESLIAKDSKIADLVSEMR